MGIITISLDDETESTFRKKAYQMYGRKKGVLRKALAEALQDWSSKKEYLDDCLDLLEKGENMGKMTFKSRDDLHARY